MTDLVLRLYYNVIIVDHDGYCSGTENECEVSVQYEDVPIPDHLVGVYGVDCRVPLNELTDIRNEYEFSRPYFGYEEGSGYCLPLPDDHEHSDLDSHSINYRIMDAFIVEK
jgi:hypothetical protein